MEDKRKEGLSRGDRFVLAIVLISVVGIAAGAAVAWQLVASWIGS